MSSRVLLLLFLSSLSLSRRTWSLISLESTKQSGALCNDRSRPVYYQSLIEQSSKWLIFLPGGAGCYNQQSCLDRLQIDPALTSTRYQKPEFPNAGGIFTPDCERNPAFCDSNVIFISYCSSDWWSGDASFEFQNGGSPFRFEFRGSLIVREVVQQVLETTNLPDATQVVIGGNSAGGLGALINADRVAAQLRSHAGRGKELDVRVIVDSSVLLRKGEPFKELACNATFLCNIERGFQMGVKIWNNQFDQECQQRHSSEPWQCFMVDSLLHYVNTPVMIVMHKFDIWQWWSDGLQTDITKSRQDPDQVNFMAKRGQELIELLQTAYDLGRVHSVFVSACIFHSTLQFSEEFLDYQVDGTTVAGLADAWLNRGEKRFVLEQCEGMACSQACTVPEQMIPKHIASFPPRFSTAQ